jgi:hypothetical protein
METIAFNFHDEKRVLKDKYLKAGDDAANVKWHEIDSSLNLFASHKEFIRKVVDMHDAHWEAPGTGSQSEAEDSADSERKSSAEHLNASRTSMYSSSAGGGARMRSSDSLMHNHNGKTGNATNSAGSNSNKNSSVYVHT